MRRRDQAREVVLRHALTQRRVRRGVGSEGDFRREAHQRQLVRVLDHPAAGRNRRPADELHARRGAGDAVGEHELRRLFDADAAGRDAAVAQALGDERVRALVLVPRADVEVPGERRTRELFARAVFLEGGADGERLTLHGDDDREEALAAAPVDVGEVDHRRAAGQHQRVDAVRGHQPPRLLRALAPLVGGDRLRLAASRLQRRDRRRDGRIASRLRGGLFRGAPGRQADAGYRGNGEKCATREHEASEA